MAIFAKNHHRCFPFLLCGWALGPLLFMGCSLAWACTENFTRSTPNTISSTPIHIINLGPAFKKFLEQAPGKPFQEQLQIWDEVIEKGHQNYFAKLVWVKDAKPNWQDDKEKMLKYYFQQILGKSAETNRILRAFESFDAKVQTNLQKFLKSFPDAKLPQNIYAGPALNFTGKAAHDNNESLIGFGIDLITKFNLDINVIFSHELFHIYHRQAAQIDKYFPHNMNELPLAFLWKEGLATYVSQVMNDKASLADILTSKELPKVSEEGLYWLASKFLADLLNDSEEISDKWFVASGTMAQQDGIPARSGYLLGYRVIQMIAHYTECSTAELAHWNYFLIREELMRVLTTLANQYPHHQKPKNFYTKP